MMKYSFLFIIFLMAVSAIHAQSAAELEEQYLLSTQSIRNERNVLDSLNRLMENTAKDIEREKKNSVPDRAKIVKWMAHAVTISNQIKEQQKGITYSETAEEEIRKRLERVYTQIIDSLKQLERSNLSDDETGILRNEMLSWTEKRILVTPMVSTLTFEPRKVQEIDLESTTDPLDRSIAEDYLKKALDEIDTHLQRIIVTRQEHEEITVLRRRTTEFVNEAYDQGRIGTITRSQTIAKPASADGLGSPLGVVEFTTIQVKSVVGLIQQLNSGMVLTQSYASPISSKSAMTQEEYIQLLKQAEKQLKSYRDLVQKKLK